ncbi:hypothetical protein BJX64DRAFT_283503 [Aspergillus heterothallicus]
MRDTLKLIPGIAATKEQKLDLYERIQADLLQPDSVRAAALKTGATHAFIYATLGASPDHMRSTAEALRARGTKHVVLLSSLAMQGDICAIQPSNYIRYQHAQVKISLEDVFSPQGYAFLDLKFNYITPEDIGSVYGTILAGALDSKHDSPVYLLGPEDNLTISSAIKLITNAIKQPVKVIKVSLDKHVQTLISKSGLPEPFAKVLTLNFASLNKRQAAVDKRINPDSKADVEKYLKRPAMRFTKWAERNKDKFRA